MIIKIHFLFFIKDLIYLFLERGEGREEERDGNINVWEKQLGGRLRDWVKKVKGLRSANW